MSHGHPFIPNSSETVKAAMLKEIGLSSVEGLFEDISRNIRLSRDLSIPKGMSEQEVRIHVESILSKNRSCREILSFLGGGVWRHYVPALVDQIVNRGEFLTSYTPYQPEISQGMLQALFEYQSMICELTAMEYTNSSVYDWSTALGEAARMAARATERPEFLVPHFTCPERLQTLRTFADAAEIIVKKYGQDLLTGQIDLTDLESKLSNKTAGVYIEYPSYLGFIEEKLDKVVDVAHKHGALVVFGIDPVALGMLKPPGEYGADIVIGEGQPLGNHVNYGGPCLGIFCCSGQRLLRDMPGRIIGMTTTKTGAERAYAMALMTREQHIRRSKATSNICTNEALLAVAAAAYLSLLGPEGLRQLCETIVARADYAMKKLSSISGVKAPLFEAPHFKEFVVSFTNTRKNVDAVNRSLLDVGIQGGLPLSEQFPELGQSALYCVTEMHTESDLDRFAFALAKIVHR